MAALPILKLFFLGVKFSSQEPTQHSDHHKSGDLFVGERTIAQISLVKRALLVRRTQRKDVSLTHLDN